MIIDEVKNKTKQQSIVQVQALDRSGLLVLVWSSLYFRDETQGLER